MKVILLMTAAFVVVASSELGDDGWEAYKRKYHKHYGLVEDAIRFGIYITRKMKVFNHNNGPSSYKMGINYFTDLFDYELRRYLDVPLQETYSKAKPFKSSAPGKIPDSINWVEKGAVTSVKDQKQCGSSYAFSAAGALEGLMFRANQEVKDLSVQELVDCDTNNYGCKGGWPQHSFEYVMKKHGIDTDASYPYEAHDDRCRADDKTNGTTTGGRLDIDDEETLKEAVGLMGPVSILYSVGIENFFMYASGIYDDICGSGQNHAMLAVGYDTDDVLGKDYWLIKNSWSDDWGDGGYVKIVRNENKCHLAERASIPTIGKFFH